MVAGLIWLGCTVTVADAHALFGAERHSTAETRIVANFAQFAGSEANAWHLFSGLREGRAITLVAPARDGGTAKTVTFTPPTPSMGYLSAFLSLGLARQQLAMHGIKRPAPGQIEAALSGGTIVGPFAGPVELPGVLRLRAEGAGWDRVAAAMGVKLSAVVSEARSEMLASTGGDVNAAGSPMKAVWYLDYRGAMTGRGSPLPTR